MLPWVWRVVVVVAVAGCAASHTREAPDAAAIEERIRAECGDRCEGRIISVEVGLEHSCALYDTGGVVCWGAIRGVVEDMEELGPLGFGPGLGFSPPFPPPMPVRGLPPITEIGLAELNAAALAEDRSVFWWGREGRRVQWEPVRVNLDAPAAHVAVGRATTAVLADGTVATWPNGPDEPFLLSRIDGVVSYLSGTGYACVLHEDGSVACRGDNDYGQLGNPEGHPAAGLVPVVGLSGVTKLVAGHRYTCALRSDGAVYCWGDLETGVAIVPEPVAGLHDVIDISAYPSFFRRTCAVRRTGQVLCWGRNDGTLGLPRPESGEEWSQPEPAVVEGLEGVVDVAISARHGCAVTESGTVYCWGSNRYGKGGFGAAFTQEPRPVIGLPSPSTH